MKTTSISNEASKLANENKLGATASSQNNTFSSFNKREKMTDWWPFRWDPSACSSSSAKGIGAGTMKKEDIKL